MIISRFRGVILAAGLALLGVGVAQAQQLNVTIVASCGAANFYGSSLVGQFRPATMDVNGILCSSTSTGGGGGGGSGGAVYGTDATGVAPTKPPLFIAGVDGSGNIKPFTITANGLQFFATSLPLPTGASTDASVQAVKTALGSPFQAGGNIGNTGFNALQNGAANSATNQFFEQTVGPSMQAPGTAPTIVRGVQGAAGGIPVNTNAQQINGTALATGTGASNAGTPRVAVSSDSTFAITNTSFASTQSGTWNVGLLAGSAIIGKVGIDQTTPGTTNRVSIGTDGTVAATQSGAYTVTQGPAGSTAWKVDGSGVTQPVSAASLPLPAGAATAGNQTSVQSAPGTSAGTALTIQGVTNGVAIPTSPTNAATVATAANQNSTAAGTSATNAQAVQGVTGGVALPISGTVTANLGTIGGAATAANQPGLVAGGTIFNAATTGNVPYAFVTAAEPGYSDGRYWPPSATLWGGLRTASVEVGSGQAAAGITPTVSQSATSQVAKASQGNLYSVNATNLTTTAGFLVTINATAAPASGAAITPIDVVQLGGTVGAPASVSYGAGPPEGFATGIVALITTSLTTYTPGGNAIIKSMVR